MGLCTRLTILLLASWSTTVSAQVEGGEPAAEEPGEPQQVREEVDEETLHNDLRDLRAVMERALNDRDLDTIIENAHENVIFTTMNGDVVRGRDGVRDYFSKMMEGPDKVVESVTTSFTADDLSLLYGGDTAVAFGHTDDHYVLADGTAIDISARWSATMIRTEGRWLIANFHYSTNMFDNPVLDTQRTYLMAGGGVAAVLSALIFFLVGRRFGKKPA